MSISVAIGPGITALALRGRGTSAPAFGVSNASDGSATVVGIIETATSIEIDVIDTLPADFEGPYTVLLTDLSDGVEMLAAPIISGTAEVGQVFTGTQALWVYDPAAYATAGKVFAPTRLWHRDGVAIAGEDEFTFTPSATGTFTLVETVEKPDGNFETAISNEIVVSGAVALTSELLDNRWIDLSGIVPDGSDFAMVMLFDDLLGVGTNGIVTNDDGNMNYRDMPIALYMEGGSQAARISTPLTDGVSGIGALAGGWSTTVPGTVALAMMGRTSNWPSQSVALLTRAISAINADHDRERGLVAAATDDFNLNGPLYFNRGRGASFTNRLPTGAKLRFLWIKSGLPSPADGKGTTLRDGLLDQFFEVTGTAPNIVVGVKPLAADGTVTVGGVDLTPDLLLAGEHFGQYDDAGTKRLTNRGTGADPILNGDFFA